MGDANLDRAFSPEHCRAFTPEHFAGPSVLSSLTEPWASRACRVDDGVGAISDVPLAARGEVVCTKQ